MKRFLVFGLFSVFALFELTAQMYPIKFERIGVEQGFQQSSLNAMVQDSIGFLWLGTPDALYKYDGNSFTAIKHDPGNINTLSDNNILSLFVDSKGILWIGTAGGGLNRFDSNENKMVRYKVGIQDEKGSSDVTVRGITQDKYGFIWFSTANGLNRLDQKTGYISKYLHDPENINSPSGNDLRPIYCDRKNNIWAGTDDGSGLIRYDISEGKFYNYIMNPKIPGSLSSNIVRSFVENKNGTLFIGTDGGGLLTFDHKANKFTRVNPKIINPEKGSSITRILSTETDTTGNLWIGTISGGLGYYDVATNQIYIHKNELTNPYSLATNRISCILQSQSKIMWFGTWGGGINKYSRQKNKFNVFRNNPENPNSLSENTVRAIYETKDSKIWIGTIAGGLNEFDRKTNSFTIYRNNPEKKNSLSSNDVSGIMEISDDVLLIGTWRGGLNLFDRKRQTFSSLKSDILNPKTISDDRIQKIFVDSKGRIWIGTENGLNQFNYNQKTFLQFKHDPLNPASISDNRIQTITEDSFGNIWVGTWGGLNCYVPSTGKFFRFIRNADSNTGINNDNIISLYQNKENVLWIGTYGGGLNKMIIDPNNISNSYVERIYTEKDGLSANSVYAILEDQNGNFWLSTTNGLTRFSPSTGKSRNYDVQDGLQSNEFYWGAFCKTKDGTMLFGGVNGFNLFDPLKVYDNNHIPTVVLTSINRLGKPIQTQSSLQVLKDLELDYDQNDFTIEYAALDYVNPVKNHYAFKLEGFNKDWIQAGNNRSATYTNLSGGTYVFRVIGSNSDDVWNYEGASLIIRIKPPFWETWWFLLLIFGSVIFIGYFWYKTRIRKIENQKILLEQLVSERTTELQHKKDELETINAIVKTVNSETQFEGVIKAIVGEIAKLKNVDITAAFIFDKEINSYRMNSGVGINPDDFNSITFRRESIEKMFIKDATEFAPDIWLTNYRQIAGIDFFTLGFLKTIITIPVRVNHNIEGYLIFGNKSTRQAFSNSELHLLGNLKEHLISAFIKTRILEELSSLNEKKNEFLGFAAHDLRSPLTVIINYLSLVTEQMKQDEFNKEKSIRDLNKVLTVTQTMSDMVTTLLDISAIESGKVLLNVKKGNLKDILYENEYFHRRLATQKNIKIEYVTDFISTEIIADHERIVEVIDNLVSNAIKYTQPGGNIKIFCELKKDEIITNIQDNGLGLTKEDLTQIFNSYTKLSARPTAGETSTGLGLAIVKKIINLHGGKVWVVSEKGKGSTFSFSLPISKS